MTPFGSAMRELRQRKGITQRALAQAIGVTPAYLSALEHGHRGRPTFELLQRIAGYFNIIWDEADDLFRLADTSDPKVVIDTAGLPPEYTLLANQLSKRISTLTPEMVEEINRLLESPQ
ncbi:helix-turn-helix domain-containing protein [Aliirhizobium smilacinae]|uniref:Helix-turn-helix transcriptional regulator n=1 Tax=Aliirhizobium smilacinae TaxID=1395944 RepID=A0A5C4XB08_9HYPH|nr:helix-turn-helix transcriptional regulator [Rhizobium smilacinae]TNM60598.1 helix-turn-helix transcriptional regulator [Rhizobium smilacinae]